ncbi:beta-ketoacyl-ACP synthase III [Paenibacillus agricola]|uniref:Beta-ketoacyl-ACP synthase III n=1 Tax=Paenibacillus agricola TaxID=2716264 RepID=A0ABX0IZK2_9BACL|nr:beta-ketoacyl-ACP synthase III [Paenibacillus agricola]NHN28645.1 beta-ketoacyl-ACP synthase III [Paenibacillus agricola]
MKPRKVKIVGTGTYLPKQLITSDEMDRRLGVPAGWTHLKSDVKTRHFILNETASEMGASAAYAALEDAGLAFADIDCIVCTSGTMQQPIPCTAVLIQKAMQQENSGVPCFDVNATCLSFVTGLDLISYLIDAGRYRRVLLVATEIASEGINFNDKESAALFGDGAAAVVIEQTAPAESSAILHAAMETYSSGSEFSEIRAGGSAQHAKHHTTDNEEDYLFRMNGHAIFRMASKLLPPFVEQLLLKSQLQISDISLVIPHQGSAMAMKLLRKRLNISEEQLLYTTPIFGNTIAASIPIGLHEAIRHKQMSRGDRILLLGTSAGLSLGGVIFEY